MVAVENKNNNNGENVLDLDAIRTPMKLTYESCANLDYDWRIKNLKQVKKMLSENKQDFIDALGSDLAKHPVTAEISEVTCIFDEINLMLNNLKQWMEPEQIPSPVALAPCFSQLTKKPLSSPGVLIIGPFNYPLKCTLQIAVGSLAAGNPTVMKPSELCPATSALLKRNVDKYFDKGVLQVVEGGIAESTALTSVNWGTIIFTGSQRVGKIIAEAASKTLTPCVLELGGKCPCIVDESCPGDITQVANRIIWGKTFNAGQTCVAIDYVLCHKKHIGKLKNEIITTIEKQFTKDPKNSELGRMVSKQATTRCIDMIQEVEQQLDSKNEKKKNSNVEIIYGGSKQCDVNEKYVCPTIVLNPPKSSRLMNEEIFAPILPIITYENRDEAIHFINNMTVGNAPLALYVFTKNNNVFKHYVAKCPAAAAFRNDAVVHLGSNYVPLGGLGSSGYGKHSGKFTFETLSHTTPMLYRPCAPGMDVNMIRFHPFGKPNSFKAKLVTSLVQLPPVPVLRVMDRILPFGLLAVAAYFAPASTMNMLRNNLATGLTFIADMIRKH